MNLLKVAESEQFIHYEAQPHGSETWFFLTVVYGHNALGSWRDLWADLLNLQPVDPWVVTGDFNCIRSSSEKIGSTSLNRPAMNDLNGFIQDASLLEMSTMGFAHTWCNMNQSMPIHCRLDRTLISLNCLSMFPVCVTHVGPQLLSDHNPLLNHSPH